MSSCKNLNQTAVVEAGPEGLGIHPDPSYDSPISARAPDGITLDVLRRFGGWFAVRYNETEGFVSGDGIVLQYT